MSTSTDPLALLGGAPAFATPLYVGRPNLPDRAAFLRRVEAIFDRCWLSNNGPCVVEFEERLAALTGAGYCVAMCNATLALEIAARALRWNGEVIVPSYTFIATVHALHWQGITPVFADIAAGTSNLDPARLEQLITPRTTGILGVHVWGQPCDTDAIESIAARHGLPVLYDAAHAFGCTHHGKKIGNFGRAEVFSFHATKFINSFEGGAVVTNDAELARDMRLMRNFGFSGYDTVIHPGTNGKMTEVCAAMGLCSLDGIEETVAVNRNHYARYAEALKGSPGLTLIHYDPRELNNFQYIVVEGDPECCPLDRDALIAVLHAENVLARKYFWPGCHRMEPYRSLQPQASLHLPWTERYASRVMVLPTGTAVTPEDIARIGNVIRRALQQAPAVQHWMVSSRPLQSPEPVPPPLCQPR